MSSPLRGDQRKPSHAFQAALAPNVNTYSGIMRIYMVSLRACHVSVQGVTPVLAETRSPGFLSDLLVPTLGSSAPCQAVDPTKSR
jgi:hypothetical protein